MNKKKVILFLAIVLLVILAIFETSTRYIENKLNLIHYENTVIENTIEVDDGPETGYRTIALLGLDSRYDYYETCDRTDCVMIAVINNATKEVTLMSVYRDTYVEMELDGETKYTKINQAYYGGVENTLKTINKNFDLNITEYAMVNFSSLSDIIDALDGIDIDVDSEELKYINGYTKDCAMVAEKPEENIAITTPGMTHLNGCQAVAYCRIRYTEGGDYKRTERMREVFTEASNKIKKMDLATMDKFTDKLLPEVRTNIPKKDILGFTKLNVTRKFGWPYTTEGVYMQNEFGESDFYGPPTTLESNVLQLHKELYGDENYVVPDSVKQISENIIRKTGKK